MFVIVMLCSHPRIKGEKWHFQNSLSILSPHSNYSNKELSPPPALACLKIKLIQCLVGFSLFVFLIDHQYLWFTQEKENTYNFRYRLSTSEYSSTQYWDISVGQSTGTPVARELLTFSGPLCSIAVHRVVLLTSLGFICRYDLTILRKSVTAGRIN